MDGVGPDDRMERLVFLDLGGMSTVGGCDFDRGTVWEIENPLPRAMDPHAPPARMDERLAPLGTNPVELVPNPILGGYHPVTFFYVGLCPLSALYRGAL
jgi:hypothetical protein